MDYPLKDLLQNSILASPAVSVSTEDLVSEATNLLPYHLETFTDSLVVAHNENPVGMIGGVEILEGLLKNPASEFFTKTTIKEIMSTRLIKLESDETLGHLIGLWRQTNRAFAIMSNKYHGYSAISARRLLEVAMSCQTSMTMADVSKRKIITFERDQTMREIIKSMFKNMTRKLILEGTSKFISDRIIIQKISRELDCLRYSGEFLEMRADEFVLGDARKISGHLSWKDGCKLLYEMQSPYLLISDGVVTPWDVVSRLDSGAVQYCPPPGTAI